MTKAKELPLGEIYLLNRPGNPDTGTWDSSLFLDEGVFELRFQSADGKEKQTVRIQLNDYCPEEVAEAFQRMARQIGKHDDKRLNRTWVDIPCEPKGEPLIKELAD